MSLALDMTIKKRIDTGKHSSYNKGVESILYLERKNPLSIHFLFVITGISLTKKWEKIKY